MSILMKTFITIIIILIESSVPQINVISIDLFQQ